LDADLQAKLERLQRNLRVLRRVAVAFSGGVDSVFLLKVAAGTLGAENVLAVTGESPSVPARDLEDARKLAAFIGVEHVLVDPGEFENSEYLANPVNRCYFCKAALYDRIKPLLEEHDLCVVVCGTNAEDLDDYRPGRQAGEERYVREPIADAGMTKADVRALSAEMGLPTADKPSSPCLASRVPYGEPITREKLAVIDRAETFLREEMGAAVCRVRHHGALAVVEVPASQVESVAAPENRRKIEEAFRALGFHRIEVDPRGFRSGSLNEPVFPSDKR
jgi:uncharacterized protein